MVLAKVGLLMGMFVGVVVEHIRYGYSWGCNPLRLVRLSGLAVGFTSLSPPVNSARLRNCKGLFEGSLEDVLRFTLKDCGRIAKR